MSSSPVYSLGHEIGSGTFSRVYATSDPTTGRPLAIKCALDTSSAYLLAKEAAQMRKLAGCTCLPQLVCVQQSPVRIVMERVGKTLLALQQERQQFSVKTTAMLALQALSVLEELHSFGFLHKDIKPDNLALGPPPTLRLLDLGLSSAFLRNGTHVGYSEHTPFQGTPFFCSVACLRGIRATRRDDLEALGYVLVYLQKGFLPWFDCDASKSLDAIKEKRLKYPVQQLCEGLEPEFREFILGCQATGFADQPDYPYFRSKFTSLLQRLGEELDWKYDWECKSHKTSKVSSFRCRNTAKVHSQRRTSLPVTQTDCEEQTLTPVASIAQLPAFKFQRPRSRLNTEKREFKGFRPLTYPSAVSNVHSMLAYYDLDSILQLLSAALPSFRCIHTLQKALACF